MPLTMGLTGMDPATEAALTAAFAAANARFDGRWRLLPEDEARHIVVDMDSMYGPMSWLRLHAAGKQVVGLTSAPRAQTDFRLGRPFNEDSVAALLQEIADRRGTAAQAPRAVPSVVADDVPATAPPSAPAGPSAAPTAAEARTGTPAAVAPLPEPPAAAPPAERRLADWLVPGALSGRVRYRHDGGPTLLIDADARTYHGPAALKPLARYFDGAIALEDFRPLDADAWTRESAVAGQAQPLLRLVWLGGLLAGGGRLLPGLNPEGRYRLSRWPQTEREYPRHFRIATAMMKEPATLAGIAEASGLEIADVADFVNANLATGFAEAVVEAPPDPADGAKPTGLLGRLRKR